MVDFSVTVAAWVQRAKEQSDAAFRAVVMDALARVKELTPVKTGYLRSQWSVIFPGDQPTPNDLSAIDRAKAGDVLQVVNPVKYARRIEYGFVGTDAKGRAFNQPGRGMVQQTVKEIPLIATKAVDRVKRGS